MTISALAISITDAIRYLEQCGEEIPLDITLKARQFGALKAEGDLSAVNATYNDAILQALINYFEGGAIAPSRNAFKRAMIQAFGDAFDHGYTDGGGELPIDDDSIGWLEARLNQEIGYIDMLFEQMKALRKEPDFDYFSWATLHTQNYVNTLREIYNSGKLRVMDNVMVTFDGDDGAESCPDCQKLKGKRHKISWFIARDYVPPFGRGLECHPGRRCQHGLRKDDGEWVTV
jgi:hypothetical protein